MPETELHLAAVPPKRPWHQYSLRTLLLLPLMLALFTVHNWPYIQRQYIAWRLQGYLDMDLMKLPVKEQTRVFKWLGKLTGRNESRARLLHNADIPGIGRRTLVLELYGPYAELCSHLDAIDSRGRATCVANLGYFGPVPLSAALDETRHGFLCLTLETSGSVNRPPRYFYRIADGEMELMRMEKHDGTLWTDWRFGLPRERSDLQSLLESPDRVQQLRGLAAYLDGNPFGYKHIDDKVRHRLSELANSPDPWIREEAKCVLDKERELDSAVPASTSRGR